MVRKLKFHEKKLLKKVDFINWKDVGSNNLKEVAICRRYGVTRAEYTGYNKLCRQVWTLSGKVAQLEAENPLRTAASGQLTEKLYTMGLIKTKRLKKADSLSVKAFCRRRLPVYMIQSGMFHGPLAVASKSRRSIKRPICYRFIKSDRLKMNDCSSVAEYVEHGHVRIGPNVVRDPAFLVTRNQEDFITWTDKMHKKISTYRAEHDDYED
jgi:U3 small nucleolar ribonucleoprotein protein IMP3